MAKVGRNAPCPCGSGLKYKKCCLPKEQAAQMRALSVRRDDELLWGELLAFAQRPAFLVDLDSAFSRFWNADVDLDAAETLDRQQLEAFLEWFILDYRTSKERKRLVELYAEEQEPRLTPERRALLAEREASHLSLYGVEEADAEGRLEIGDLLAGGYYRVEDAGLARLAMPGDLLLGRRLGDAGDGRLSRGTVLLPAALGQPLVAAAKQAYGAYRDEHYQATWPEFLRENGCLLFHFLLTPEVAAAYERAPRRPGYFDPRAAVEGLRAIMQRRAEEAAKQAAEEEERLAREEEEREALRAGPAPPPPTFLGPNPRCTPPRGPPGPAGGGGAPAAASDSRPGVGARPNRQPAFDVLEWLYYNLSLALRAWEPRRTRPSQRGWQRGAGAVGSSGRQS